MKYVKPEFMVEEFGLNESIALCKPEEVTTSVEVHCLKTNKHEIFESQCSTKFSQVGDDIVTYNGQQFLVWGKDEGTDIDCDWGCTECNKNEDLFEKVVENTTASRRDHIALIDGELKYAINMSQ